MESFSTNYEDDSTIADALVALSDLSTSIDIKFKNKDITSIKKNISIIQSKLNKDEISSNKAIEFCKKTRLILQKYDADDTGTIGTGTIITLAKDYIETKIGETEDLSLVNLGRNIISEFNAQEDMDTLINTGLNALKEFVAGGNK